jgi:hypothetical protein
MSACLEERERSSLDQDQRDRGEILKATWDQIR